MVPCLLFVWHAHPARDFHGRRAVPRLSLLHRSFEFVFARFRFNLATAGAWYRISLIVKLHSEIQTHAAQDVANFSERLLPKVLGGEHLSFRALDQVANRFDTGVLQAIVRTNRKLELVDRTIELIVA